MQLANYDKRTYVQLISQHIYIYILLQEIQEN